MLDKLLLFLALLYPDSDKNNQQISIEMLVNKKQMEFISKHMCDKSSKLVNEILNNNLISIEPGPDHILYKIRMCFKN